MRSPQFGFPTLVQDFFLNRLIAQRGASARTVESYRDAFELLFAFTAQHTGKHPSDLRLADLDAPLVLNFLDHLQTKRGNSIRTRNARLAATRPGLPHPGQGRRDPGRTRPTHLERSP